MSNIASMMITLIFGIPGFMIGGLIGMYVGKYTLSAFIKLNILVPSTYLDLPIGIAITLITALAGFALSAASGKWLISKIW